MPSEMANAQADLISNLKTEAGETVTYRRGDGSVSLTSVVGRSSIQILDQSGSGYQETLVDFVFDIDDLVISSVAILPERFDTIERSIEGDKTATYEVLTDGSRAAYDIDPLRTQVRVHAKLKAVAS